MRKLRAICMAVALTLAFASHSLAGIIGSPPEPPPPSNQQNAVVAIVVALIQIAVR